MCAKIWAKSAYVTDYTVDIFFIYLHSSADNKKHRVTCS